MPQSKYAELLAIIEELGKEIRPTYAGSKSAMERLKRGASGAPAGGASCVVTAKHWPVRHSWEGLSRDFVMGRLCHGGSRLV